MNPSIIFMVIMCQTVIAIAWLKLGNYPFFVWVFGCAIADFLSFMARSKT